MKIRNDFDPVGNLIRPRPSISKIDQSCQIRYGFRHGHGTGTTRALLGHGTGTFWPLCKVRSTSKASSSFLYFVPFQWYHQKFFPYVRVRMNSTILSLSLSAQRWLGRGFNHFDWKSSLRFFWLFNTVNLEQSPLAFSPQLELRWIFSFTEVTLFDRFSVTLHFLQRWAELSWLIALDGRKHWWAVPVCSKTGGGEKALCWRCGGEG